MIELNNLYYGIPKKSYVLSDVNVKLNQGDYIGILGKNGAGKTTLIDLIMGFKIPVKGEIKIFGNNPALSDRKFFSEIAYLSQDVWLKENIRVEDFFKFHRYFYPNYSIAEEQRLVGIFDIDCKAKIGGQSTGQKRRIQIISALAAKPKIILVDEITAVLDPDARHIFFKLLNEVNEKDQTTILLATNIVEDLKGRIKGLYFIKNSKLEKHEPSSLDSLFSGEANE